MKKMFVAAAALSLALAGPVAVQAAEAPVTVDLKRLSLPRALRIAQGAVEACTEKGIQIGVTVVDREGNVQVTLRDTIAAPITASISRMKAYTAANFNAATSALEGRADSAVGRIDGFVMSAGGVPIEVGGALVGAVGVSGAPQGETDEACAQAGVDDVRMDLEMAM
jgi:uncharacterized protein GlcG (DUF336 family)